MKEAIEKHGAKLIVIDPRRIELCDFATLFLPLQPGTNVVVFNAMAHVIVKEGLVNREFIDARTEGYDEFVKSIEKYTPEYAESISGVDRNLIIEAARLYATAKNGAIYWGMGISQLEHGHGQRVGLDSSRAAHRSHRARGHGAESAARAEQRAGRVRLPARCRSFIPATCRWMRKTTPCSGNRRGTSSRAA